MLSIARAIIEPRQLFLIDEPTKGLAPAIIANMIAAFQRAEIARHDHPASSSRISCSPNRSATASRSWTMAAWCTPGGMAALAEDHDLQHRLLGLSLD